MHNRTRTVSRRLGGGSSLAFPVAGLVSLNVQPSAAQTCPASPGSGNPCVLTGQYNNHRDGYNNNEKTLTSQAVTTTSVTQVLADSNHHTLLTVDSNDLPTLASGNTAVANPIYSQPLYVPGIAVSSPANTTNCNSSTTCNMVVSSTLNGTLFAWNADNGTGLWARYGSDSTTQTGLPTKVGDAFWKGDCGTIVGATSPSPAVMPGGPLQFIGNLSTGVIDTAFVPSTTTRRDVRDQLLRIHQDRWWPINRVVPPRGRLEDRARRPHAGPIARLPCEAYVHYYPAALGDA